MSLPDIFLTSFSVSGEKGRLVNLAQSLIIHMKSSTCSHQIGVSMFVMPDSLKTSRSLVDPAYRPVMAPWGSIPIIALNVAWDWYVENTSLCTRREQGVWQNISVQSSTDCVSGKAENPGGPTTSHGIHRRLLPSRLYRNNPSGGGAVNLKVLLRDLWEADPQIHVKEQQLIWWSGLGLATDHSWKLIRQSMCTFNTFDLSLLYPFLTNVMPNMMELQSNTSPVITA